MNPVLWRPKNIVQITCAKKITIPDSTNIAARGRRLCVLPQGTSFVMSWWVFTILRTSSPVTRVFTPAEMLNEAKPKGKNQKGILEEMLPLRIINSMLTIMEVTWIENQSASCDDKHLTNQTMWRPISKQWSGDVYCDPTLSSSDKSSDASVHDRSKSNSHWISYAPEHTER